jgi:hypothetical protein
MHKKDALKSVSFIVVFIIFHIFNILSYLCKALHFLMKLYETFNICSVFYNEHGKCQLSEF